MALHSVSHILCFCRNIGESCILSFLLEAAVNTTIMHHEDWSTQKAKGFSSPVAALMFHGPTTVPSHFLIGRVLLIA